MIQINLVPDIKAEFIKAEKTKSRVIAISVTATTALVVIAVIMYSIANFGQKDHISNLQEDIDAKISQISSDTTAIEAVTVNNQLKTLQDLHLDRPAAQRLPGYLSKIVPSSVTISSFQLNFEDMTATVSGSAGGETAVESAKNANIFIDTVRNAQYKTIFDGEESQPAKAFTELTVESIGTSEDDGIATGFSIVFNFSDELFRKDLEVVLSVPQTSSDQTTFERSDSLFNQSNTSEEE